MFIYTINYGKSIGDRHQSGELFIAITEEQAINGHASKLARDLAYANSWDSWIVQRDTLRERALETRITA